MGRKKGSGNGGVDLTCDVDGVRDDGGYDPSVFRTPATDSQGHSSPHRLYCRVPPGVAQQVQIIMQGKKFPYKTDSELIRHAILRHLHWLTGLEPVKSVMGQVDALCSLFVEEEQAASFETTFGKMSPVVSRYIGMGEEGEARRLVMEVYRGILDMPDGFWKTRYLMRIRELWGYLMDGGGRAQLTCEEDGVGEEAYEQ